MLSKDKAWMGLAIEEAQCAFEIGEVPVGAVAICENLGLLAKAHNQTISACDPCAHAEITVIRKAAEILGNHRLSSVTLYVSLEPCAMCAGAIVQARIPRVVFATRDWVAGAAGTVMNLLNHSKLNHHTLIDEGLYQQEAQKLLQDFFKQRR